MAHDEMASANPSLTTASLPEKPDSAGSASIPPQHIAVEEPAIPLSERLGRAEATERAEKKKMEWTWRGLGRFWERRREDGSKKYAYGSRRVSYGFTEC